MILIIDNFDSFVYNLAQYVGELGFEPRVFRNDAIELPEIRDLAPTHIIISPGPKTPKQAGISTYAVSYFGGEIPILGICLGHQCIVQAYGGRVVPSPIPTHGKSSSITHDGKGVFQGVSSPLQGGRYHSLMVELQPDSPLEITARSPDGLIMGVRHYRHCVEGLQFHPESILTDSGHAILKNFLSYRGGMWPDGPEA